jgi:AraC family transcriptional regulator
MTTTPPSTLFAPGIGRDDENPLLRRTRQNPPPERTSTISETCTGLPASSASAAHLFGRIVEISPFDAVKRHSTGRYEMLIESIYVPAQSRIECRHCAPSMLLVMYDDGIRRDGETSINHVPRSKLRNLAKKLTFVPANHAFYEWHEPRTPIRLSYLYLDLCRFDGSRDEPTIYTPRAFFDDSVVWDTANKLRNVVTNGKADKSYVVALTNVLAHELSRSEKEMPRDSSVSRGGLATWQMRAVTRHIEEHLCERTPLATLAKLVRLSPSHFCRAFRQSFGIPPYEYHIRRRIEKAKALLAEREASVTGVGFAMGYSHTSSFSIAFRKITGQTPIEFRRDFT